MSNPECLFCTQPHTESQVLYRLFEIKGCDEHEDNLKQLYAGIERYFDYLSRSYGIVAIRVTELKVGDLSHWQQYPVKVTKIKVKPSSMGGNYHKITFGLPECFSLEERKWSKKIILCDDELCIKLIENPRN